MGFQFCQGGGVPFLTGLPPQSKKALHIKQQTNMESLWKVGRGKHAALRMEDLRNSMAGGSLDFLLPYENIQSWTTNRNKLKKLQESLLP